MITADRKSVTTLFKAQKLVTISVRKRFYLAKSDPRQNGRSKWTHVTIVTEAESGLAVKGAQQSDVAVRWRAQLVGFLSG